MALRRGLKTALIIVLIALLFVVGILVWAYLPRRAESNVLVFYGNVDLREVNLAFNASERITQMFVREGDRVKEGELVAVLDKRKLAAAAAASEAQVRSQEQVVARLEAGSRREDIEKARADYERAVVDANNAMRTYDRIKTLAEQGVATQQDADNARTAWLAAQAQARAAKASWDLALAGPRVEDIAAAKATLGQYRAQYDLAARELAEGDLYAAQEGIIRDRILEPGDIATPQTPVYTVSLINPLWVRIFVPETDLGRIHAGMTAWVSTDSFPGKRYKGWVGYISPTAEFTPKTVETKEVRTTLVYQVRVYVENPENELRLGMPATVRIPLQTGAGG